MTVVEHESTVYEELGGLSAAGWCEVWLHNPSRRPRELKAEYDRLKALESDGLIQPLLAPLYSAWFNAASRAGNRPDALRIYSPDEAERFWARTVPGPDGHTYWTGPAEFTRNAGAVPHDVRPRRWVWAREHGPIPTTTDVWTTCGEKNCVTLGHLAAGRTDRRLWFRDEQMLGRIQVVALQLGHTPTSNEWVALGEHPTLNVYKTRFGGWPKACRAAGVAPPGNERGRVNEETCGTALRALAAHLGHAPSREDYRRERDWLASRGHPTSPATIRKRFAFPWAQALKKARLG